MLYLICIPFRLGELLGLTWDCVDITEEAINENRAYINVNKQVERVSKKAVEELNSKEVILIFPSVKKDNKCQPVSMSIG